MNYSDKLQTCSVNDSDSKTQDTDENKKDAAEDNIKVVEEKSPTEIVPDQIMPEISSQVSMKDVPLIQDKTDLTAEEITPSSATDVPLPQESQMATKSVLSAELDKTHDSMTTIEPSTSSSQTESTKIPASEKPNTEDFVTKKPTVVSSVDVSETIQSSSGSEDVGYKSSVVTPSLSDMESSLQQKAVDFILMKTDSSTPSQKETEQVKL